MRPYIHRDQLAAARKAHRHGVAVQSLAAELKVDAGHLGRLLGAGGTAGQAEGRHVTLRASLQQAGAVRLAVTYPDKHCLANLTGKAGTLIELSGSLCSVEYPDGRIFNFVTTDVRAADDPSPDLIWLGT